MSRSQWQTTPVCCDVNRHRAKGSDTWGRCALPPCMGLLHRLGTKGGEPACLGTRALTSSSWKAVLLPCIPPHHHHFYRSNPRTYSRIG